MGRAEAVLGMRDPGLLPGPERAKTGQGPQAVRGGKDRDGAERRGGRGGVPLGNQNNGGLEERRRPSASGFNDREEGSEEIEQRQREGGKLIHGPAVRTRRRVARGMGEGVRKERGGEGGELHGRSGRENMAEARSESGP